MNVLVIPEDFRKDQFVLRPIIEAMMKSVGKHKANVRILMDPLLGGIAQATRWDRIEEILERYRGMVSLFLLVVDRDGVASRRTSLDYLEAQAARVLPKGKSLLCENAWQEVEVWILAGCSLPKGWHWKDIRSDRNPKENYYDPFARFRGVLDEPGEGRGTLATEAASNYARLRSKCPEDVGSLESRIRSVIP